MQAVTGVEGSFEKHLADKASILGYPIGANLELIPVCNMDCKMCYVRTDMKEVNRLGGLPDLEMWFQLGRDMKEMGTLFVLLTGGEPLMHPHFKEIYRYYHELGFILTVNTNGTLINEDWGEFFAAYPPRRLNITIYGKDNDTYHELCCNPRGFDQFSHGIAILQKHNIPLRLNCSLTVHNYDQWEEFCRIAKDWNVSMESAYYMMPPGRKITHSSLAGFDPQDSVNTHSSLSGFNSQDSVNTHSSLAGFDPQDSIKTHFSSPASMTTEEELRIQSLRDRHNRSRLQPEKAAEAAWNILTEHMNEDQKQDYIRGKLSQVDDFIPDKTYRPGYRCRAGNSSFWVKWDGSFTACGMMGDKEYNIRFETLPILWEKLKERTKHTCLATKCTNCRLQDLCPHCAASEYTENGEFGKEPEYLCQFAQSFYRLLQKKSSEKDNHPL